jgi:excisionase family DNA binding protein
MVDADARKTISIVEAGRELGIGRDLAYAAAKRGEIPTIKIGTRLLVPRIALEQMLAAASHKVAA